MWSLSVSILVLLRCSFAQVGRVVRRRAESHFDSVWASRNDVPRLRARAKNRWKIVPVRLLPQITQQLSCYRRIFRVWMPQNGLQELSGTPREGSRGPLGRSWVTLGELLGRPRAFFRALGALSGHSWSDLGAIMSALGIAWTILDRPWMDFGRSSTRF